MSAPGVGFSRLIRQVSTGPVLIDPATLALTAWMDANDFVGATHPAQPAWAGRASLGASGARSFFRRTDAAGGTGAAATANPTASTLNAKASVSFANAGGRIRATATPTTLLAQSSFFSTAGSFFSFVGSFDTQATGSIFSRLMAFGPDNGFGLSLQQDGGYISSKLYDGAGYQATPSNADSLKAALQQVLVQGRVGATTNILEMRIGKGAWVQKAVVQSGFALTDQLCLGASQGFGDWIGQVQELMTGQYAPSNTVMDQLADRANSVTVWGVPV